MGATGTATLNFGATPGTNLVTIAVTGQAAISTGDAVEAFFMAETTTDHNVPEHIIFKRLVGLSCGTMVAGTGFTITAETELRLTGTAKCRWVWSA